MACNQFPVSVTLKFFVSISNVSHVIRDFYTIKLRLEVVLVIRWRPKAEMTSQCSIFRLQFCIVHPLNFFRQFLTVQKLFECLDLAGKLTFVLQNLGVSYVLTPNCSIVSTQPTKDTFLWQTSSFEPCCV
jgi:hypothetical protein